MKKKYQITLVVIGCLIVLIGLSYAYFVATSTGGGPGGNVVVNTYTIDNIGFNVEGKLEFDDLDIYPGHKNIAKIKVDAIGNEDIINYKLVWEGINTLNTPLKYYVYKALEDKEASITCKKEIEQVGASKIYYETCSEENIDSLGNVIKTGEITKAENSTEFVLANDEVIKGTKDGNTIYYYVILEYPNLNESQNIDMGGTFEGKLTVKKEEDTTVDVNIKKIYQETENGYEEINRMPNEGYVLNSERSSCTNNATPVPKGSKILITNLTTSNTECNIYFDKDKEKPVVSNITPVVAETEITVAVEATDNVGITEYYYQIDDSEFVKGENNTYTFTGLDPKTNHSIKVYVKDGAGNESEQVSINASTIDTTKPIISNVTASSTMTTITVNVEATDNVGITEYYYKIDNNEYVKETSNTYTFTDLEVNSSHTISVYVKDASGNQSDTSTNTFTTAPDEEKPIITNVETNATETEISVTVEATDNVGITEYWYQIDSNTPVKGTTNTYTFTGLTASTDHIINVYVKDAAGNQSETTTKSVTTPDTTKPTISNIVTSGTETEITVIVTASDNVGVTEYWFAMDSGSFTKVTTNTFKFTGLSAGVTRTISVYVKDSSGNQSETRTESVTTPDTTNPIVTNITTSVTETEINVTVAATDNTGVAEYWYAIDNDVFTRGTGNTHKFTGLAAKTTHTVKVYAKDNFGNQSATLTATATTLDTTAPTILNVTSSVTMTEITVNVSATDNVGVTEYWYSIDNGAFIRGAGNTYTFTGLGINSGHTINVFVKDASGNQSVTSSNIFVTAPDSVPPTISNVITSVTKTEINVTIEASDNVGVTEYWYQLDSNAAIRHTGNTYQFTGITPGSTHTINVFVKDGTGNQSATITKNVTTKTIVDETLAKLNVTPRTGTPNFSQTATTDEGVYRVEDGMYGGYSYYWRGAVTNNYVKFANFCWRIVRINGDGSIRMIYDGTTCHANGESATNNIAVRNVAYNTLYDQSNYVGWTYTGTSQRTLSGTASTAKSQTESWYNSNLASYASKIANGKFCNDRNVQSGSTWKLSPLSNFYYAAYARIAAGTPTLSCTNNGDVYSLKVGAITADEIAFAGGVKNQNNGSFYLYNGNNYWTMTPGYWEESNENVETFYMFHSGYPTERPVNYGREGAWYDLIGLRPVINLKADTLFATGGTGTQSNPYVVS